MMIPLYFRFRSPVRGRGFAADVRIRGRITCVEEYGATCAYGVNPGGLAGGGVDMKSAYVDFRAGLAGVLFDLARDAETFDRFSEATRTFIAATDNESVREWETARDEIRAGAALNEGAGLRRETAALAAELSVQRLPESTSRTAHREREIAAVETLTIAA